MRILSGVVIAIVVVVLCALGFIYSGVYNIAANEPHTAVMEWALGETMESSVRVRAAKIKPPAGFESINTENVRFVFYSVCATCHSGKGAIARGLNPPAPNLSEAANELSPSAIFWIVKNGIKMTGMPTFATAYSENDIWAIAALVKKQRPAEEEPKKE